MLYMSDWEINRSKVVVYIKMYNKDIGMHRMHEDGFCEPQLISISIILTDCLPLSHNGTLSVVLVQHRQVCQPLWYVWNLKKKKYRASWSMAPPTGQVEKDSVAFETRAEEFFLHCYHNWASWRFFAHPLLYCCRPNQSPQSEHGSQDRGGKCFLAVELNIGIALIFKKTAGCHDAQAGDASKMSKPVLNI